jgi:hypothetical protein
MCDRVGTGVGQLTLSSPNNRQSAERYNVAGGGVSEDLNMSNILK